MDIALKFDRQLRFESDILIAKMLVLCLVKKQQSLVMFMNLRISLPILSSLLL